MNALPQLYSNNSQPIPTILYLQGGAALGAFTAGAIEVIARHPRLKIIGISGTSINALQGAFAMEALIKNGQESIPDRLNKLWSHLSDYQRQELPFWYSSMQTAHTATRGYFRAARNFVKNCGRLASFPAELALSAWGVPAVDQRIGHAIDSFISAWATPYAAWATPGRPDPLQLMVQAISNASAARPMMTRSPIIGALDYIESKGSGLDFKVLAQTNNLCVNASAIYLGQDPWKLPMDQGAVFRKDITPNKLAASGALPEIMSPEFVDGVAYYDGGLTANPVMVNPHDFQGGRDALCILIRTRPTEALSPPDGSPKTDQQRRAYFNTITDRAWRQFDADRRNLQVVIEPHELECGFGAQMVAPEMDFGGARVKQRMLDGRTRATEALTLFHDLSHPVRKASRVIPPSRFTETHA
jgi:hypothetical protein